MTTTALYLRIIVRVFRSRLAIIILDISRMLGLNPLEHFHYSLHLGRVDRKVEVRIIDRLWDAQSLRHVDERVGELERH